MVSTDLSYKFVLKEDFTFLVHEFYVRQTTIKLGFLSHHTITHTIEMVSEGYRLLGIAAVS